jgi:hypothetical protein
METLNEPSIVEVGIKRQISKVWVKYEGKACLIPQMKMCIVLWGKFHLHVIKIKLHSDWK